MTQQERVEGFKKGLEALQKEFQVELKVFLNTTPSGIVPVLQLLDTSEQEAKPEAKSEAKPEAKSEAKSEAKPEGDES